MIILSEIDFLVLRFIDSQHPRIVVYSKVYTFLRAVYVGTEFFGNALRRNLFGIDTSRFLKKII